MFSLISQAKHCIIHPKAAAAALRSFAFKHATNWPQNSLTYIYSKKIPLRTYNFNKTVDNSLRR